MTPNQIELIRETWKDVAPVADSAARMFYDRLFEIDLSTRALFANTDMAQQRNKLTDTLALVVANAAHLDKLTPVLADLGRSHVRYGVQSHHYDSVGAALLWTFERMLGPVFNDALRTAWTNVYVHVATIMKQAAEEAEGETRNAAVSAPKTVRTRLARAAVATCLALSVAGGMTVVTAPMTATPVEAFGWKDIKKGVKKAGSKVKKVGAGAVSNAKDFGSALKRDTKKIGSKVKKVGAGAASNAKDFGSALNRDMKKIGNKAKAAGKTYVAIGKAIGGGVKDVLNGYEFKPPRIGPEPKPPIVIPGPLNPNPIWTGPIPGIRPAAGAATSGNKNTVSRDKSVMGRPLGIEKPNLKPQPNDKSIKRDRPQRSAKHVTRDRRLERKSRNVTRSHRSKDVKRWDRRSKKRKGVRTRHRSKSWDRRSRSNRGMRNRHRSQNRSFQNRRSHQRHSQRHSQRRHRR